MGATHTHTDRVRGHPSASECLARQSQARTGTKVHVLGDSTRFLYKYHERDEPAAKEAHDAVHRTTRRER